MAVAPMTVTALRQRVLDFSEHFMELGISIMVRTPARRPPGAFSFLSPLALEVWAATVAAGLVVVSVLRLGSFLSSSQTSQSFCLMASQSTTATPPSTSNALAVPSPSSSTSLHSQPLMCTCQLCSHSRRMSSLSFYSSPFLITRPSQGLGLKDCFWFTLGSAFKQGNLIFPRY